MKLSEKSKLYLLILLSLLFVFILSYLAKDLFQSNGRIERLELAEWIVPTLIGCILITLNIFVIYRFTNINRDIAPWFAFFTTCFSAILVVFIYNVGKDMLGIPCTGFFGASTSCASLPLLGIAIMGGPIFPILGIVVVIIMIRIMRSSEKEITRKVVKKSKKSTKRKGSKV